MIEAIRTNLLGAQRALGRGLIIAVFGAMSFAMVAPSPAVAETQEQAALGNPDLGDALSVSLPEPLSERDAELYEQIFAVQEQGRWTDADRLISRLNDDVLMGHVIAQRYLHPTAYRSRYKELKDWLAKYADLPQAPRIYKLALTRRGSATYPKKPVGGYVSGAGYDYEDIRPYYHKSTKSLSSKQRSRLSTLKRRIRHRIGSGWPTGALQVLESQEAKRLFDAYEQDQARTSIASGYYYFGKPDLALKFVQYILSPEGQARLATSSCYWGMPANAKADENLTNAQKAALRWDDQAKYLKNSQLYPIPDADLDAQMQDTWVEMLQQ